jgi:hypothetical protein
MLQRLSRTADAEESFIILDKPEENYIPNICINAIGCVYTNVRCNPPYSATALTSKANV